MCMSDEMSFAAGSGVLSTYTHRRHRFRWSHDLAFERLENHVGPFGAPLAPSDFHSFWTNPSCPSGPRTCKGVLCAPCTRDLSVNPRRPR